MSPYVLHAPFEGRWCLSWTSPVNLGLNPGFEFGFNSPVPLGCPSKSSSDSSLALCNKKKAITSLNHFISALSCASYALNAVTGASQPG